MINEIINLWDDSQYTGTMEDGFMPKMTTYIRSGDKSRGIVVILPGGGYGFTSPREAEPIAIKFNDAGYHAVFVDYSVAPRRHPLPILDVARTLTLIKEKANEWRIDLDQIFVCGFSAGGHLCASISTLYEEEWLRTSDGIDIDGIAIKGSILAYPVISYGANMHQGSFMNLLGDDAEEAAYQALSLEKRVNKHTPPAFIWHTFEDGAVPVENAMAYASALRQYDIPFELHIYPKGGHGLSLATEEVADSVEQIMPHVATWMDLCIEWMVE